MHRDILRERIRARVGGLQADDYTELPARVHVATDHTTYVDSRDLLHHHILAQGRDGLGDDIGHFLAIHARLEQRVHGGQARIRRHGARELLSDRDEVVGARNEVRLATHLDHRADASVDRGCDHALAGRTAFALARLRQAALAQQFVCPLEITLRLGERSFAIHHARACLVAKRLYVSC